MTSLSESLALTDAIPAERRAGLPSEKFYNNQGDAYFHESLVCIKRSHLTAC